MNTIERVHAYNKQGGKTLTPAQRRRMIKKAGRDPQAIIIREDGMGYARSRQGERILIGFEDNRPTSGAGYNDADVNTAIDQDAS